MKRFFITLLVLVVVLVTGVYFFSSYIFEKAADKFIPRLLPQLAQHGIHVSDHSYSAIKFSDLRTVTVYDMRVNFNLKQDKQYESHFSTDRINFTFTHIKNPAVLLTCENFNLNIDRSADIPGTSFGRFDNGYVKLHDPITLSDPQTGLNKVLQNVSDLFDEKQISPNITLNALVTLKVGDKKSQAYLYTVQREEKTAFQFEHDDIRKMADTFEIELSDEEVAIIAEYPLRAPVIMRITSDARETSRNAHRRDPSVPEDAYRHVLWSYLLTQTFGEAFAEKVTDAHETLPTNTAAERKMDFHNNRLGREFANSGVDRNRILWLVKYDPRVIRTPESVG